MSESRDSKRRASLKRDFSVDKEDRRSFRGKLACLRYTFGKFQWPSRVQGRDDHRATVGSNGPCARVRFCVCVCTCVCVATTYVSTPFHDRARPLSPVCGHVQISRQVHMVSLFSRLAFSLATPTTPTTTRCCSSRLSQPVSPSSSLLLARVSVSLSFHILAVAHTWRAYAYTCMRARSFATVSPFLPLPSFEGYVRFHTNASLRWSCTNFFYPLSLRFPCISQFFFTCFLLCLFFLFSPLLS